MEPIGVAASVLSLVDVALRTSSALVKFSKDVKHASRDRKLLVEEAMFLAKLLERLKERALASNQNSTWEEGQRDIVGQFAAAYQDLANLLNFDISTGQPKDESRFKTLCTSARWSFSKAEVYDMLQRITRLQQYTNVLLSDKQQDLLEQLDQKHQEALDQMLKVSVLNWLSPLQMAQIHQTISDRVEKGCGEWFLSSDVFSSWMAVTDKPLWCWGIPGAGKTVLASITVNHLRRGRNEAMKSDRGIAVMYIKYNDPEQTLENLLGSLLRQLIENMDGVPQAVLDLYDHHRDRNTLPSVDDLCGSLLLVIDSFAEVFLIIDALDECSEELRWELLERLETLEPHVHLLITSRYLDSINEELRLFSRLEVKAHRADIELFIDHQIKKNRNLRKIVERSHALRCDIKDTVVKTAEHMFLLARLHVESLASAAGLSVKHVRNKLRALPNTLTGAYDSTMQRIQDQESDHQRIALKTLAWLTHAIRSMSLKELQHALAIEPCDTELDDELMIDGQSITSLCAGLVSVDQGTNMVNLVHHSTKTYFEENRERYFPNFHASMTLSLATYLTLNVLQDVPIKLIVQQYPLACYAAQYLGEHARMTPEEALEPSSLELICQLLSHPDKRKPLLSLLDGLDVIRGGFYSSDSQVPDALSRVSTYISQEVALPSLFESSMGVSEDATEPTSQAMLDSEAVSDIGRFSTADTSSTLDINASTSLEYDGSQSNFEETNLWEVKMKSSRIPEVTALHLAASMGLAKVASMLLKETPNIDAVDETGKTALAVAIERGFEKAVEFLVTSGACVDLRCDHGRWILLRATERNWQNVGNIIGERARTALKDERSPSAHRQIKLILAIYYGQVNEMLDLIQQAEFDVKSNDRSIGEMALFIAVEREYLQMVQGLLSVGVDVNAKDSVCQTALHRATRRANEEMMKLLLKNGAEVDAKDDDERTAWSANVRLRNPRVLGILLQAGADPSTRGLQGVSELYTAAKEGDTELVRFMLASGTNPSVQTQYKWTPLHWASSYGHIDCVKYLIEADADLSTISDQKVTPLDLAIHNNQHVIIGLLQRAGAKKYSDLYNLERSTATLEGFERESDWVNIERMSPTASEQSEAIIDAKTLFVFDKPLLRTLVNSKMVGQFIYPRGSTENTLANRDIYQISHVLEDQDSSMSIRRARRRADMHEYPLSLAYFDDTEALYDIQRTRLDYQEFELRGRHQNPLPGTIRMHRDWTGSWKVRHHHVDAKGQDYFFRTTAGWNTLDDEKEASWISEDSKLLARTGWDDDTPNMCFEMGLDRQTVDLMVTCWVTKLWSETVTLKRRK